MKFGDKNDELISSKAILSGRAVMHIKRINLFATLIILLIFGPICPGEEKAEQPVARAGTQQLSEGQLNINRLALQENKNEQIRLQAASLILEDDSEGARKILLETLKMEKNTAARIAVCRALGKSRTEKKEIKNKEDFIIPLLSILVTSQESSEVKLAAEALLIFEYSQISSKLNMIAADASSPLNARLNAIYALRLQSDMNAIIQLIRLAGDAEPSVAAEAEGALQSVGISVGKDAETRERIIKELESKGKEQFLQERLVQQKLNMDNLEVKIRSWRERYLTLLDTSYSAITEDTERGRFLSVHLSDSEAAVKLWALDKVSKWRAGTGPKSNIPAELGPSLIKLISDEDKQVRLKTAVLLPVIGELDSAGPLAEQFKVETDPKVKDEILTALGWACYYGSLPNASIKVSPELIRQSLQWAQEFLVDSNSKRAIRGSEVIGKLLENANLSEMEVTKYLSLLASRYIEQKDKQVDELCSELLGAMARLCGKGVNKGKAADIFRPLFEDALKSESDTLRQASVDGLIYIDKVAALSRLGRTFNNDKSPVIRKKIIELAGEIGGREDLVWLSEKIGSNPESKPAWQAMLKIFKRTDIETLGRWIDRLDAKLIEGKLLDEQMLLFFETVEGKAATEKNAKMLIDIRSRMARLYKKNGNYERAAQYYGILLNSNPELDEKEKEVLLAELLDAYLSWPNMEQAEQLINNRVLSEDLEPGSQFVNTIEFYLINPSAINDANGLFELLCQMEIPQDRPKWAEQIQKWSLQFIKVVPEPNMLKDSNEEN